MTLALALLASAALAQADAAADTTADLPSAFNLSKAHVGKGHFTLGTSGGLSVDVPNGAGGAAVSFSLFVNGGYFVHDRVLVGGHLGLSMSSFLGTFSGSLPLGGYGEYWHPLSERLFLFAGLSVSLGPTFGPSGGVYWAVVPHAGLAIFLNDWLAVKPGLSLSVNSSGVNFSLGWGIEYYL